MKKLFFPAIVALMLFPACDGILQRNRMSGIITTVAGGAPGDGYHCFVGQPCPATSVSLNWPASVAVDSRGNVYTIEASYVVIVDSNGILSPFAGNGTAGILGDGGPALQAQLYNPSVVAVDVFDNLYIADWMNYRVRKVDTNGIIITVAGNGTKGYSGDGGLAVSAEIGDIRAIATASLGDIFLADGYGGDYRVRIVDSQGYITTIAGGGATWMDDEDDIPATTIKLRLVTAMAVDYAGNIYIPQNLSIRKIDTNGNIRTIAEDCFQEGCYWGDNVSALTAGSLLSWDSPLTLTATCSSRIHIPPTGSARSTKTASLRPWPETANRIT
jgi:hypothetical protein